VSRFPVSLMVRMDCVIFLFIVLCIGSLLQKVDIPVRRLIECVERYSDRLSGLVVRVSGYRGPGFDPRRYQIF